VRKRLDKCLAKAKNTANFRSFAFPSRDRRSQTGFMTPIPPPAPSPKTPVQPCKHPRVQIVSRDEDSEYVECKECGEIFESSEFKDMLIEDTKFGKES
jgi:hypothetical protein